MLTACFNRPKSARKVGTGTAEVEFYPEGDPNAQDYHCEYWVPLKKGKNR